MSESRQWRSNKKHRLSLDQRQSRIASISKIHSTVPIRECTQIERKSMAAGRCKAATTILLPPPNFYQNRNLAFRNDLLVKVPPTMMMNHDDVMICEVYSKNYKIVSSFRCVPKFPRIATTTNSQAFRNAIIFSNVPC
jgi:hypothetical protein